jgi:hypothetical protein
VVQGMIGEPKTHSSLAPVPVIRQLAQRLEMHRLRSGNPQSGPIFANSLGKPLALRWVLLTQILPAIEVCVCGKPKTHLDHVQGEPRYDTEHHYQHDPRKPEWHGFHACRRGLPTNLFRLGIPAKAIQLILRHSDVSVTNKCYILPIERDAREAMTKFESAIENPAGHTAATEIAKTDVVQ